MRFLWHRQANCSPPPVGPASDVSGIVASLKDFQTKKNIPKRPTHRAVMADDTQMPNGKLLNRDDLDAAFPDNPVMVIHVSLHGAVINSMALKQFNFSDKTVTPPGGVIVRKPGTNEPYGLIMETAFPACVCQSSQTYARTAIAAIERGTNDLCRSGCNNGTRRPHINLILKIIENGAKQNALFIDVVAYPFITDIKSILPVIHSLNLGLITITWN